jgi:3-deoxy-7-phosphoheptulonate synthase
MTKDTAMLSEYSESSTCDTSPVNGPHRLEPMLAPNQLAAAIPLSEMAAETVAGARRAITRILSGADSKRLAVVVGPCSIHDPDTALEYARRLRRVAVETEENLVIVMRSYLEKPRTKLGWKGFLNDPDLDGSCNLSAGAQRSRELLLEINELGLACGSELLDPMTPHFVADLLGWGAIGARTTPSQTHREMASGLSMPVGFKNGTDGDIDVSVNAVIAAASPHTFFGISRDGSPVQVRTHGNAEGHIVLRGGTSGPNFAKKWTARAADALGVPLPARRVMVDCSHGNSNKDHRLQAFVCREVLRQTREPGHPIMGLMLESNLHAGQQTWKRGVTPRRGVSITDACIGWGETEDLLNEISEAVSLAPQAPRA